MLRLGSALSRNATLFAIAFISALITLSSPAGAALKKYQVQRDLIFHFENTSPKAELRDENSSLVRVYYVNSRRRD